MGGQRVPIVPAAILFDLLAGGDHRWTDNPYPALGRAAFEAATHQAGIGSVGAGTGATTAAMKGGLGTASLALGSGITVAALVAANPMGSVTTPGDRHFWAAPFEIGDEFGGLGPDPASGLGRALDRRKVTAMLEHANTTIAIVATDAALDKAQCQRVAIAAHDGIARACVPAHSPSDGDLVFAAATGVMPLDMPESVLVRFSGEMQPGITLRDLVHAIPYYAIQHDLLTVAKKGKKNIFSGRILEMRQWVGPDLGIAYVSQLR